jgi:hypothetical protein
VPPVAVPCHTSDRLIDCIGPANYTHGERNGSCDLARFGAPRSPCPSPLHARISLADELQPGRGEESAASRAKVQCHAMQLGVAFFVINVRGGLSSKEHAASTKADGAGN